MIFGKSTEQKNEIVRRKLDWHDWFAWYPIRLKTGRCCWLERVRRLGTLREQHLPETKFDWQYVEKK